jgi:hypothetical protein
MNDPRLFRPWFTGPSWDGWRIVLKAAFALPMTDTERQFFRSIADREPPAQRVREAWFIIGRRGGKDSIASLIAGYTAALFQPDPGRLRRGERALVSCLACDREQAKIVLNYTRAYFADTASLILPSYLHARRSRNFRSAVLERRTSPAGRDRVDHGPAGADDACNAAAGAMVLAVSRQPMIISPAVLARARQPDRRMIAERMRAF